MLDKLFHFLSQISSLSFSISVIASLAVHIISSILNLLQGFWSLGLLLRAKQLLRVLGLEFGYGIRCGNIGDDRSGSAVVRGNVV